MKKRMSLLLIFSFLFLSCKEIIDLRNDDTITNAIIKEIKERKVVFVGENHNDVYPIIMMSENLEKFYDAGIRYIILESYKPRLDESNKSDDYYFIISNPIQQMGWKYEEKYFENAILKINNAHGNTPIKIVFPEKNLTDYENIDNFQNEQEQIIKWLNYRDEFISNEIIKLVENSKNEEKFLIFYGSTHGCNTVVKVDENLNWTPFGVYLKDYFSKDYTNFEINPIYPYLYDKFYFKTKSECVCLSETNKRKIYDNNTEYLSFFDNYGLSSKLIPGVPYNYVPSEENLLFLLKYAKELNSEKEHIRNSDSAFTKMHEKTDFVLVNYYLKYWFGRYYEYDTSNSEKNMANALTKLENNCFANKSPEDFIYKKNSITEMEEYIKYLYCDGAIEQYLTSIPEYKEASINFILNKLKYAKKINVQDIWPQYWSSYFLTEKATITKEKKDFKIALKNWKLLLTNDLIYASPVLNISYKKMSLCEENLGNLEEAEYYLNLGEKVVNEIDFDYKFYKYFGY